MKGASYERFLKKNCATAYDLYQNGEIIASAGWTLFACGLGFDIGSTIGALILSNAKVGDKIVGTFLDNRLITHDLPRSADLTAGSCGQHGHAGDQQTAQPIFCLDCFRILSTGEKYPGRNRQKGDADKDVNEEILGFHDK